MKKSYYKKRIGIDARFILRPLRGIPLYVTRLCQHLPALNPSYLFYLFINRGFEHNDLSANYQARLESLEKHNNIRIINMDDDAEIRWEQIYLPRLVKKYKIDLLHMPANRIYFKSNIPIVVTIHDIMEYFFLSKRYSLKIWSKQKPRNLKMLLYLMRVKFYIQIIYSLGFKKAKKIITVSRHSANDIINVLGIIPKKVEAIYHGVDNEFLVNKVEEFKNRKYVLMLGGDSYQKNPEGAIAAWAKVSQKIKDKYFLKIIGFCGNEKSPLLEALRRHNLLDKVVIKGWLTQKELIENFRKAALFLYLSRYEGFGFPILQAMACGTPVISTNKASLPEVLGDVGFQFDPDNYQEIATAIEKVLTNNQLWDSQFTAGFERARAFTWQLSAQKHMHVYEDVLKDKSCY